jgi:hypothetical protein
MTASSRSSSDSRDELVHSSVRARAVALHINGERPASDPAERNCENGDARPRQRSAIHWTVWLKRLRRLCGVVRIASANAQTRSALCGFWEGRSSI